MGNRFTGGKGGFGSTVVNVRFPSDLLKRIDVARKSEDRDRGNMIRTLVREGLDAREPKPRHSSDQPLKKADGNQIVFETEAAACVERDNNRPA